MTDELRYPVVDSHAAAEWDTTSDPGAAKDIAGLRSSDRRSTA